MKPIEKRTQRLGGDGTVPIAPSAAKPDLNNPSVVLSLLETDQVIAAKEHTRFGRRKLSFGVSVLLWGLRVYVVAMLVLVVVSVLRVLHAAH